MQGEDPGGKKKDRTEVHESRAASLLKLNLLQSIAGLRCI